VVRKAVVNLAGAQRLAREGRLYPAVILHGAGEEERQVAALDLGRTLLCAAEPDQRPCGICRHCARLAWPSGDEQAFHPDFRVLQRDLKTVTSVDATKTFLQMALVAPFEARGQVFVIASADTLSGEAANALLKLLEEPPSRSPRHFLLLSPSQFDLLPTVRSRSLSVFLGVGRALSATRVESLADRFAVSVTSYVQSGDTLDLMAAAEELMAADSWQDPRSLLPWSLVAAAVKESRARLPQVDRRPLLALAEDLLSGWRLRVRGIQAQRILEGLVVRHLSRLTPPRSRRP
jgi:hypothetical protein